MRYANSRKENIVVQELEKEILIYDLKTNRVFCLNQTSASVWNACDGNTTVFEISKKTQIPEDAIWLTLDQLKDQKLIENYDGSSSYFNRLTRREIIKRVGLASMVALPLITVITAPKAANAASGVDPCAVSPGFFPSGCVCFADIDCLTRCCKKVFGSLTGICADRIVGGACP